MNKIENISFLKICFFTEKRGKTEFESQEVWDFFLMKIVKNLIKIKKRFQIL